MIVDRTITINDTNKGNPRLTTHHHLKPYSTRMDRRQNPRRGHWPDRRPPGRGEPRERDYDVDMQDVERREWQSGNPTEHPRSDSLWGTDNNWATTREEPPDLQRPITYRLPPSTQITTRRDDQPIQWSSSIFQNTVGNLTREELRSGARVEHRRSDERPDYPEREKKRSLVIEQLRELGIDTALDADEELPMEARTIIEDLIFSLQQKNNEVKHLQRKVNDLRKEMKTRKRADSDEVEHPPPKRPGVGPVPQAPSIRRDTGTGNTVTIWSRVCSGTGTGL